MDSSPRAGRPRGARTGRQGRRPSGKSASRPFASGRAPSAGLQLAVDRREDPEPDEEVCEGQEGGRIKRGDPSDERLYRDVKADPDVGIQRTAGVVDESERDVVGPVFQVQMQRGYVR